MYFISLLPVVGILRAPELRWYGYIVRILDERPVKKHLYEELADGARKQGRPFKDNIKDISKRGNVLESWKHNVMPGGS